MRNLIFVALFLLGANLAAQESTSCDTICFRDSTCLIAKIIRANTEEVVYEVCGQQAAVRHILKARDLLYIISNQGSKREYNRDKKPVSDAIKAPLMPLPDSLFHIETIDDNDFTGQIIRQDADVIVLKTEAFGDITIRKARIKSIEVLQTKQLVNGEFWYENPHSTRYFFNANAYGLRKGEGYYQNTWILFNQVSVGLSDNVTIGLGTVPIYFFGANVYPFWVTPKVTFPIKAEKLNIGAGAFIGGIFTNESSYKLGITYGIITYGTRDRNATFGLGYGFADNSWANAPTLAFSAMHRTSKKSYFITENYFIPSSGNSSLILSVGGRWTGKRIAIDYGAIRPFVLSLDNDAGSVFFFIPWLGINVPFGQGQAYLSPTGTTKK